MRKLILILALAMILTSCIVIEEAEEPQEQIKEDNIPAVIEEKQPVIVPEPEKPVETVKEVKGYIAENLAIPEKYWYYDTSNNIGATVYGNDRASMWEDVSKKYDLAIWNPETKELYTLFGQISKYGLSKVRDVDYNRGEEEYYMAYIRETMKSYPWSPVDWMVEMKDATPTKIDKSEQVIHVENRYYTSDLALTYEKGNEGAILHFDSHYKVPVYVERMHNGAVVERIKYYYDDVVYDPLNKRPKQITKEMVTLPKNHVILTMDEARAYVKGEYFRDPVSVNPIIAHANVIQAFGLTPGLK